MPCCAPHFNSRPATAGEVAEQAANSKTPEDSSNVENNQTPMHVTMLPEDVRAPSVQITKYLALQVTPIRAVPCPPRAGACPQIAVESGYYASSTQNNGQEGLDALIKKIGERS